MIRPSHAQRALAYVANGDWPPLGLGQLLPFVISTTASLVLGVLLGSTIV
jgi:hypothetical protein